MKLILMLIIVLLTYSIGFTQPEFAPIGAEWYFTYREGPVTPDMGYCLIKSIKDTTIDLKTCKVLSRMLVNSKASAQVKGNALYTMIRKRTKFIGISLVISIFYMILLKVWAILLSLKNHTPRAPLSNNIMDYNANENALTICQINRMHYFLLGGQGNISDCVISGVSVQNPTIVGPDLICSTGATYTLSNLQLGVTSTWITFEMPSLLVLVADAK